MVSTWHRGSRALVLLFAGLCLSVIVAMAQELLKDTRGDIRVGKVEAHGRTWVLSRTGTWAIDSVFLDTYGPQRPSAADDIVRFHASLDPLGQPASLPWWFSVPDIAPSLGADSNFEVANVIREARGFPLHCLVRGQDRVTLADGSSSLRVVSALPVKGGHWAFDVIPVGLVVDTVFYGVVLAFIWLVPRALFRNRRQRRGLCIACGYARAGLASATPCPECGQPAN